MAAKRKTRKKNLSEINQTHGKVEKSKPTTLDQIWGNDSLSRYSTLSYEEYQGNLKDMDKSKMKEHAIDLGLVPIDNLAVLQERLLAEFRAYIGQYASIPDQTTENQPKASEKILKILREGS